MSQHLTSSRNHAVNPSYSPTLHNTQTSRPVLSESSARERSEIRHLEASNASLGPSEWLHVRRPWSSERWTVQGSGKELPLAMTSFGDSPMMERWLKVDDGPFNSIEGVPAYQPYRPLSIHGVLPPRLKTESAGNTSLSTTTLSKSGEGSVSRNDSDAASESILASKGEGERTSAQYFGGYSRKNADNVTVQSSSAKAAQNNMPQRRGTNAGEIEKLPSTNRLLKFENPDARSPVFPCPFNQSCDKRFGNTRDVQSHLTTVHGYRDELLSLTTIDDAKNLSPKITQAAPASGNPSSNQNPKPGATSGSNGHKTSNQTSRAKIASKKAIQGGDDEGDDEDNNGKDNRKKPTPRNRKGERRPKPYPCPLPENGSKIRSCGLYVEGAAKLLEHLVQKHSYEEMGWYKKTNKQGLEQTDYLCVAEPEGMDPEDPNKRHWVCKGCYASSDDITEVKQHVLDHGEKPASENHRCSEYKYKVILDLFQFRLSPTHIMAYHPYIPLDEPEKFAAFKKAVQKLKNPMTSAQVAASTADDKSELLSTTAKETTEKAIVSAGIDGAGQTPPSPLSNPPMRSSPEEDISPRIQQKPKNASSADFTSNNSSSQTPYLDISVNSTSSPGYVGPRLDDVAPIDADGLQLKYLTPITRNALGKPTTVPRLPRPHGNPPEMTAPVGMTFGDTGGIDWGSGRPVLIKDPIYLSTSPTAMGSEENIEQGSWDTEAFKWSGGETDFL